MGLIRQTTASVLRRALHALGDTPAPEKLKKRAKIVASAESSRTVYYQDQFPGITPARLAEIFRASNQGELTDALTFYGEMEEKDLHYAAQLSNLKLGLLALPITVEPYAGRKASEREITIAGICNDVLIQGRGFWGALFDSLDSLGKGYSIIEPVWGSVVYEGRQWWNPVEYNHPDPRWVMWDPETLTQWLWRDPRYPQGQPIDDSFLIFRANSKSGPPYRDGYGRMCGLYCMLKAYGLKDLAAFVEIFGLPLRIGTYGGEPDNDVLGQWREVLRRLGSDAAALVPESLKIEIEQGRNVSGGAGEKGAHLSYLRWLDEQISKAIVGQTMTADDGSSRAQADVHLDRFLARLQAIAHNLEESWQPLIDLWLRVNAPDVRLRFKIDAEPGEDLEQAIKWIQALAQLGLPLSRAQLYERFSLREPESPEDQFGGRDGPQNAFVVSPDIAEERDRAQAAAQEVAAQLQLNSGRQLHGLGDSARTLEELDELPDPWASVILSMAQGSDDYEAFVDKLQDVASTTNADPFVKGLAAEMAKLRVESAVRAGG